MRSILSKVVTTSSSLLLLFVTPSAWSCGQSAATLIELPFPAGSVWRANALNATSQMTGYVIPAGATGAHAFFYDGHSVWDLGTLGGSYGHGFVINAVGQIAGESSLSDESTIDAFLWSGGPLTDLGTWGGSWNTPTAINDSGQVVGFSWTPGDSVMNGFLYAGGLLRILGTLGGEQSYALAINQAGVVVGGASLTNGDIHAFSFSDGVMSDLGTLGGNYSSASAVNDAGAIVGESSLSNGFNHGFVSSGGVMTDVGTFGGTNSSCFAINDRGEIIGTADTAEGETHGFLYRDGAMTDLGTLGGGYSFPLALNNLGQVVGLSATSNGVMHGFLWQAGTLVDLNSLLPTNSGWELSSAELINDAGRIAGSGVRNGLDQMFILDLGTANHPPIAVAGPDQSVDCRTQVTLDGASSRDPDGDPLTYEWSAGGYVLGTNAILSGWFALGTNIVTLTVTDPCGEYSKASVIVHVVNTNPPMFLWPGPITAVADANCQARVPDIVSRLVISNGCPPPNALALSQDPAPDTLVAVGPHLITVTANGTFYNGAVGTVLFTVADMTGPVIQSVTASPNVLSPPDHKLTEVTVSVAAADDCDGAPVKRILSITANEATDAGDIQITGDLTAKLAASRNPAGGGRVYTITVQATDASGNSATSTVRVAVPQGSEKGDAPAGLLGKKPNGKKP